MAEDMNDIFADDPTTDGNIPQPFRGAQNLLDQFVAVGYDTTYNALQSHSHVDNADYIRERIVTILRANPPFATIPKYLRDGRENYLWYSDFYDDAGKEVYLRYNRFSAPAVKITSANYAEELGKVALPYFAELVNLVCLEKLYMDIEARVARAQNKPVEETPSAQEETPVQPQVPEPEPEQTQPQPEPQTPTEKPKPKRLTGKRSYEPRLSGEQYALLAECIENIKLFRRPTTVTDLKKLLTGKLAEPLQVTNQNSLTYIFDKLRDNGLIRREWFTIAVSNRDFLSFRRGKNIDRYGDEPHYITMQQFSNCRTNNRTSGFKDLLSIDEAMEKILPGGGK